jgi:hypothetical protein
MLKCVAFVGEGIPGDVEDELGDLCATGFFVSLPAESPELQQNGDVFSYFVTAKHVATDLQGRPVYFLVNKRGGGVTHLNTVVGDWWLHPTDPAVDVAVARVGFQPGVDVQTIPSYLFCTAERLKELQIGIGDEVFITGLFSPAPGISRNMPIVRHGNIAMMSEEQIQTELGYADVYLVEARSIGGLSGSPVFARPTINLPIPELQCGIKNMLGVSPRSYLLGLMHGHWDIRESGINKSSIVHVETKGVNLGIGIVVPMVKILETLNRPELVMARMEDEKIRLAKLKQSIPGMDSSRKRKSEDQPFSQSDFEDALRMASRRIEED